MPATLRAPIPFEAPEVSCADIEAFYATHFSCDAIGLFEAQFLRPDLAHNGNHGYGNLEEDEDDGLGYYSDGVKRTLTDEQIAIFRHSELEALRRAEAKAPKLETTDDTESSLCTVERATVDVLTGNDDPVNSDALDDAVEGSEDGEIETEKPTLTKAEMRRQKKLRARQRRKESQKFQPEKKPDLRKRTWDIVGAGMDSLHYDDLGLSQGHGSASTTQRKQISYDD
ncbi:hypothetical protein SAMD00023353_0702160 [Rosellinia necatrix]|uniref:Uncharacterized protein n=1 Tax=Rosellinia necatrix TaxID=77044 RepID=A0A1S7UM29_ROSNE|nr:hypothetical protein SAMD00023353_0702160 [Rosellinia necatrix]